IRRYMYDKTQGPACAIACGAGTLYRNYLVPVKGGLGQTGALQLDMVADLHEALGSGIWDMENGYALPRSGALRRASSVIRSHGAEALAGFLRVGLQRDTEVTLGHAGHRVSQVYASAMPMAYAHAPPDEWEPLARLVLDGAYEATLRHAARTGASPVYLTLLGGGAFGNPLEWIFDALIEAVRITRNAGLDIRIVSFAQPVLPQRVLDAANGT
ncbi:MAG: hypothetical protein AAFY03_10145, partial [Pseudomonadota bacterium]